MDKVGLSQVFLKVLLFSSVIIIPSMIHNQLPLNITLIRTNGRSLCTSKKSNAVQISGSTRENSIRSQEALRGFSLSELFTDFTQCSPQSKTTYLQHLIYQIPQDFMKHNNSVHAYNISGFSQLWKFTLQCLFMASCI